MTARPTEAQVIEAVYVAIDELNAQLPDDQHLKKSLDTELFGPASVIDSLGLVNLVVEVEEQIFQFFGRQLTLADEKAMSRKHSPFRTVAALVAYIQELLGEELSRAA